MSKDFGMLSQHYTVEPTGKPREGGKAAYHLRGPMGATIGLFRLVNDPDFMFAINMRTGKVQEVCGFTHWYDGPPRRAGILPAS